MPLVGRALLAGFDSFRRQSDALGLADGVDTFQRQAFEMLTSSRLANALDLSREDGRVRSRYGLDRSRLKGDQGRKIWTEWTILAYNSDTLAVRTR